MSQFNNFTLADSLGSLMTFSFSLIPSYNLFFLFVQLQCLAAGSSIMNREGESSAMRPLAKALTKALENVRNLLREQCLRGNTSNHSLKLSITNEVFGERLQEALKIFDRLFAEFELSYVSAMVPVKSTKEYELQQLVVVLFSETLQRYVYFTSFTT